MASHDEYMSMALGIACRRMGLTSPNPPVGAVIVRDCNILSSGGTGQYGSKHAEINAIDNSRHSVAGADMYVTLEPCCHFGKTPPCTKMIIDSGIKKVFVPIADPNPLVSGKGIAELRKSGVQVEMLSAWADAAIDIIRPFRKVIVRKKPFVISKSAMTLDGRIATMSGDSKWISSDASRLVAHRLRSKVDAVVIGKNTLVNDDPGLDVRFGSFDRDRVFPDIDKAGFMGRDNFFLRYIISNEIDEYRNPIRIIIGIPEMPVSSLKIFRDSNYCIIDRSDRIEKVLSDKKNKGVIEDSNCIAIKTGSKDEEVEFMLNQLLKRGIMCMMIEGGGKTAGKFLDAHEIDQFLYVIAPRVAGNGISAVLGRDIERIDESTELCDISAVMIGNDLWYTGYKERYNIEML